MQTSLCLGRSALTPGGRHFVGSWTSWWPFRWSGMGIVERFGLISCAPPLPPLFCSKICSNKDLGLDLGMGGPKVLIFRVLWLQNMLLIGVSRKHRAC
jgi:hypothetical protein